MIKKCLKNGLEVFFLVWLKHGIKWLENGLASVKYFLKCLIEQLSLRIRESSTHTWIKRDFILEKQIPRKIA